MEGVKAKNATSARAETELWSPNSGCVADALWKEIFCSGLEVEMNQGMGRTISAGATERKDGSDTRRGTGMLITSENICS